MPITGESTFRWVVTGTTWILDWWYGVSHIPSKPSKPSIAISSRIKYENDLDDGPPYRYTGGYVLHLIGITADDLWIILDCYGRTVLTGTLEQCARHLESIGQEWEI